MDAEVLGSLPVNVRKPMYQAPSVISVVEFRYGAISFD